MRDRDVRCALRGELLAAHDPVSTLVRDELGLCLGRTRVDLAVINSSLTGYEIKSPRDRLDRLAGQAEVYAKVLDHAVLVSAAKHLDKATSLLPDWWGVWQAQPADGADGANGAVAFVELRPAGRNPRPDMLAVAQLLWRDEALGLLEERALAVGVRTATRWRLWERLVEELEPDDLAREVRDRLRARQQWPGR